MTHKDLVKRAAAWLRNRKGCTIVLAELTTATSETPDAIGHKNGYSILIECKTSRADFHADKKKSFRRFAESGMGDQRYFMAPKGILQEADIPEGWGWLEVGEYQVKERKAAPHVNSNKRAEVIMLTSVIRRLELSTAVFVQSEEKEQS